jgi:hypothetical protein
MTPFAPFFGEIVYEYVNRVKELALGTREVTDVTP